MTPSTTHLTILRSGVSAIFRRWRSMSRLDSCSGRNSTTSITCSKAAANEHGTSRLEPWKKREIRPSRSWSRRRGPMAPIPSQRSNGRKDTTQLPMVASSVPPDLDTDDCRIFPLSAPVGIVRLRLIEPGYGPVIILTRVLYSSARLVPQALRPQALQIT